MAHDIWFSSDPHYGHANMLKFTRPDGTPVRPGFSDVTHMNEHMIERHNSVVKPGDKWYCLGDLGWNPAVLTPILARLNGKKRLLLGNHDQEDMGFYMKHFERIGSWRHFADKGRGLALVCTHFPLHKSGFLSRYDGRCLNVHGHTHARILPEPEYRNVCVETIDYTPVNYDTLMQMAAKLS